MLGHFGELTCLCCAIVLLARCLCVCDSLGGPTSTSSLHLLLAAAWQVGNNLLQDARPGEVLQASEAKTEECTASNEWAIVIRSTTPSLGLTYSSATGEFHALTFAVLVATCLIQSNVCWWQPLGDDRAWQHWLD